MDPSGDGNFVGGQAMNVKAAAYQRGFVEDGKWAVRSMESCFPSAADSSGTCETDRLHQVPQPRCSPIGEWQWDDVDVRRVL